MAPLERATGPAPSDRSSEMDGENSSSGSRSSSSTSKITSSSSSSSGSNSNISNSAGAATSPVTVADLKSVHHQENLQEGRGEEEGRSTDANAADTQVSQVHTGKAHSQARDAARPGGANGKLRSGDPVPFSAAATPGVSSGLWRRFSSASIASVESGASRAGRTSSAAVPNTADAHVRAGQLSRAGSTRASTARSRVEVRGELEITNVSSAQEILHLLEDDSSPFAIHLQNVELRVSPGQSVRLGEAVPALREHLRRDLERQMQQAAGSVREGQSPLSTGGRQNASRVATNVGNSRTRSSNILITGTVMGGMHPSLLGRSRQPGAIAEISAAPRPQASAQREPAPARRIPSRVHTGVSAPPASGPTAAISAGEAHAASAAAVPTPLSVSVAEQTQQQRASAETTSLVQQILEVQGQVKSLLAEEGLSPIAAEAAALKKKKGAQDDAEDEERGGRRILGSSGPHGSNMDEGSQNERAAQGGASSSSSSPPGSSSSSSSSGTGIFARGRLVPKGVSAPQQNNEVTAVMKGTHADRDAAGEYAKSSETERHRKLESAVEQSSSYTEVAGKGTAGGRRKSTQDEGDGRKKESDATEHEKEEKRHPRGSVVTVSGGERRQETDPVQARKELATETTAGEDVKQAPAKGSLEADSAKGSTTVKQRMQRGEGEEEGGRSQVAKESVQRRSAERGKEREQQIPEGTQKATARGSEGGTTEDSKAEHIGTSVAKQKEGGAQQVSLKETKEDSRTSTGHEESVGTPADQASEQPQLIVSAQHAVQGEARDSPEEKRAELPKVSIPHLRLKVDAEKISSTEQQSAQAKEEAEKPLHQKSFLAKPEADGRSPRAGKGQIPSTEHREGESPKKSVPRESEAPQKATTEAAASAAPTFVQALSSFFSWALAEEEVKPSPPPKDEAAADERKISAEVEADKETGKAPAAGPEGVSAPKRTTAEEAGETVEEGQEKKKPRPKLKPKAAPARVSLPKRDTE